jgi:hypothetical protein
MSVKANYLIHGFSGRWQYAVATMLALFFVALKSFPVLKGWFDFCIRKRHPRQFGLKLQVEPQLVTDADDIAKHDPERNRLLAKAARQVGGEIDNGWLVVVGIATTCVGFVVLLVFLFDR